MDNFYWLIQILGVVVVPASVLFLKSYLEKKGEGLATREDIEKLTTVVQSVQEAFAIRQKRFESEIDARRRRASDVDSQRLEAALGVFDQAIRISTELLTSSLGNLPVDDGQALAAHQADVDNAFLALRRWYHRLILFSPRGSVLGGLAEELVQSGFAIEKAHRSRFSRLKFALIAEMKASTTGDNTSFRDAAAKTDVESQKYREDVDAEMIAFRKVFSKYIHGLNEELFNLDVRVRDADSVMGS